jgi:hypothetical protein
MDPHFRCGCLSSRPYQREIGPGVNFLTTSASVAAPAFSVGAPAAAAQDAHVKGVPLRLVAGSCGLAPPACWRSRLE